MVSARFEHRHPNLDGFLISQGYPDVQIQICIARVPIGRDFELQVKVVSEASGILVRGVMAVAGSLRRAARGNRHLPLFACPTLSAVQ